MLTFEQFLRDTAAKGEAVNLMFEERLFELVGVLHRIAGALKAEGIAYELVGGLAAFVHVEEASPEHATLTRDVDLMVKRGDLERIQEVAARNGFRFRHTAGVDMLIYGPTESARNAVHLVFEGERVRPAQVIPNPHIAPVVKRVLDGDVMVIPVADLLRMKLSSYRLKDQVHVKAMDAAGLITAEVEAGLEGELARRLAEVRSAE